MLKKQLYAAPEAELLVVRFEECVMSPGVPGDNDNLDEEQEDY